MIIITGASGYVGSHMVQRLVDEGRDVRAIVHDVDKARKEGRLKALNVDMVAADVTQPETLAKAFQGGEVVIHLVAIAIEKGSRTYEKINYQGTVNTVEAAKRAGIRRFINMSQLGAASQLPYRFLASKGRAQEYVAASGLDWTAFRPSVIWGPEDEFANTFARLVPITPLIFPIIGDKSSLFQPVYVEDVVTSFLKALDDPSTTGQEYELGGPEVLTLEEIERRTLKAIGAHRLFIRFPMPVLRLIVTLMEKLLPAPPVTRSLLELLSVSNVPVSNQIQRFVPSPRPFTVENIAGYMNQFKLRQTLAQFLGK